VAKELNVLALVKGAERYVFVYDDASHQELVDAFRDHAADPTLSFSWFDAAIMTEKAQEQAGRVAASSTGRRQDFDADR
jgi:hypothetical protein